MLQVDTPLLDHVLMHLLTVLAGVGHPSRDGSLIQAKGCDNRLERTAMT